MASAPQPKYLRVIDLGACIGCGACEAACDFLHDGRPFIKVYRTSLGLDIPLSCFHCSKAPCVEVCPTGAMTRDQSGAVYVEKSKCIGCLACLYACPFSIPELEPVLKVSSKCDLCKPLRETGLTPGCVSMCPAGAILYGEEALVYEAGKKRIAESMAKARFEALR
ncbi:4Fe-4S dicluster domain-containing protein [Thermogladius sp. KZ2Tp1]|uniref:4Fe-4S dicluster domain-containing protein n=1 Tax=unclassified Thermogladius TaxID=2647734 RepID=UPI003D0F9D45